MFSDYAVCKNCKSFKHGSYQNLDENGFVRENVKLNGGDIVIGKITPISTHTTRNVNDIQFKGFVYQFSGHGNRIHISLG